ncbi:MAG: 28S ribosomal protein S5, mitochondrial [Alyxoria varia]|nr:MAG: 28S ribosomal protein S5, mitochondrial [Alyxoria varia]
MRTSRPSFAANKALAPTHCNSLHHHPRCSSHFHRRRAYFSTSPSHRKSKNGNGHRSPYRSITQKELQLIQAARAAPYEPYSPPEKQTLSHRFTPAQLASIEAAEEAVDPSHLGDQGKERADPIALKYDDEFEFSRVQPTIDKRVSRLRGEWDNYDDNASKGREWDSLTYKNLEERKLKEISKVLTDPDMGPTDDPVNRGVREAMASGKGRGDGEGGGVPGEEQGRDLLADLWRQATKGDPEKVMPSEYMKRELMDQLEGADSEEDSAGTKAAENKLKALKVYDDLQTQKIRPQERSAEDLVTEPGDTSFLSWEQHQRQLREKEAEKAAVTAKQSQDGTRATPTLTPQANAPIPKQPTTADRLRKALSFTHNDPFPDPPDLAPEIPRIKDKRLRWPDAAEKDPLAPDDETAQAFVRLSKVTGQSIAKLRSYRVKFLVQKQPTNQTRMGKIRRNSFLAVAGDLNGHVGLGEGKAIEADEAMRIAKLNAIRNMVPIRRYENRTIYGEVRGKVGACELTLTPLPPGYGLRCSHNMFEIAKAAGIQDMRGKLHRSRRPMNVCKAVWEALKGQRDPEDVARSRGRKLVDVRKVYYAGLV